MNNRKNIGIIGCGISGLSVAYILLQKGYEVTLFSKQNPLKATTDPAFASLYPAASVIPHSVFGKNIRALFIKSQLFFKELHQQSFPGLSVSRHFEIFNSPEMLPWYRNLMADFMLFDDFKDDFYPRHPNIPAAFGWKFNCYFADWNLYLPALFRKVFEQDNAHLKIQQLTQEDIHELPFDTLINCGGFYGARLFGDQNHLIYRGHLLSIANAPKLTGDDGHPISYNFSPGKAFYATAEGKSQDVYCYSRKDGWIFGGSRLAGRINENGYWEGDRSAGPFLLQDDLTVPKQILELNQEIIEHSFNIPTAVYSVDEAKMGYRFVRNTEEGLRLESEEIGEKRIIHNYGHGGAGVTLSWGCALKVAELIRE